MRCVRTAFLLVFSFVGHLAFSQTVLRTPTQVDSQFVFQYEIGLVEKGSQEPLIFHIRNRTKGQLYLRIIITANYQCGQTKEFEIYKLGSDGLLPGSNYTDSSFTFGGQIEMSCYIQPETGKFTSFMSMTYELVEIRNEGEQADFIREREKKKLAMIAKEKAEQNKATDPSLKREKTEMAKAAEAKIKDPAAVTGEADKPNDKREQTKAKAADGSIAVSSSLKLRKIGRDVYHQAP